MWWGAHVAIAIRKLMEFGIDTFDGAKPRFLKWA